MSFLPAELKAFAHFFSSVIAKCLYKKLIKGQCCFCISQ